MTKAGRHARVNPELVPHMTIRGEPRVSLAQGEMVRLEEALFSIRDTQNFLFWLMGTFVSLTSSGEGSTTQEPMLNQLALSIQ